ncbi:MAG TPA: septal ring lytic transglycosylase RlpA family protein [Micavibrio sp.]|nr:septal ring lytic transglycosylase RlpA family protein [Micavibrio sp.]
MPLRRVLFVVSFLAMTGFQPAQAADSCTEEIQRGIASWYGPGFEGALTKSKERFHSAVLSAAHPDLPFGSIVKITNLRNYRSVNVKVNDRGAFGHSRAIDVSESAANELGMIEEGLAPVAIYRCR